MKLKLVNYLLEAEMEIFYKNKVKKIDRLVVDTGAAHSLISSDVVDDIGIFFENGDELVSAYGIGGMDYSFRKSIDSIRLGSYYLPGLRLDFGNLNGWGINGLIGLDILLTGKFLIDLESLELILGD